MKGDSTITDIYRPISLLPTIFEVFEQNVFIQLFTYFSDNKLFYPSQYEIREVTLQNWLKQTKYI